MLDAKAPMVMDRNFKPGFRIDLHIKDLANALDTSTASARNCAHSCGYGDDAGTASRWFRTADHSAWCYYEKLAKVEVTR
ncbi:tartronate semialdehyde reductase [Escherichia coli]|uniref:Tartronate semialdehyde reductase n=1 Tax=Escherichia coli TaxID=562 RepID=A0A376TWE0_ECOLX|nr:tartronate semialdehyde reductase [Escherichia coli]